MYRRIDDVFHRLINLSLTCLKYRVFSNIYQNCFITVQKTEKYIIPTYRTTVCSVTGIGILWNRDCGTEFRICSANYTYRFCRILYKVRKKGEVEQHSRIGDYERVVTLQEQGPTERPEVLQTKPQ